MVNGRQVFVKAVEVVEIVGTLMIRKFCDLSVC